MWPANGTGSWSGAMLALHRTGRNYILSPTHSYLPRECPAPSFPDCVYWPYLFSKRLGLSLASMLGSVPRGLGHNSTIKKLRFKTFKSEDLKDLKLSSLLSSSWKSHALPDPLLSCFHRPAWCPWPSLSPSPGLGSTGTSGTLGPGRRQLHGSFPGSVWERTSGLEMA